MTFRIRLAKRQRIINTFRRIVTFNPIAEYFTVALVHFLRTLAFWIETSKRFRIDFEWFQILVHLYTPNSVDWTFRLYLRFADDSANRRRNVFTSQYLST